MATALSATHVITFVVILLARNAASSYIPNYASQPQQNHIEKHSLEEEEPTGLETDVDMLSAVTTRKTQPLCRHGLCPPPLTDQLQQKIDKKPEMASNFNQQPIYNSGEPTYANGPVYNNKLPNYNGEPANNKGPIDNNKSPTYNGEPTSNQVPVVNNYKHGEPDYAKSSTRYSRKTDDTRAKLGDVNIFDDAEAGYDPTYDDDDIEFMRKRRSIVDVLQETIAKGIDDIDGDGEETNDDVDVDVDSNTAFTEIKKQRDADNILNQGITEDHTTENINGELELNTDNELDSKDMEATKKTANLAETSERERRNVYTEIDVDPNAGYTSWTIWSQCQLAFGVRGRWRNRKCLDKTHCHSGDMEFRQCSNVL